MFFLNILVDYLTISYKAFDLEKTLEMLRMKKEEMKEIKSYFGMEHCLYAGGIKIHYDEYVILDMSGVGCRYLETVYDNKINWLDFIGLFMSREGSHIARLDIACDDKPGEGEKGILNFSKMIQHVSKRKYVSKSKNMIYIQGKEEMIVFGSTTSDRRLRIYNKALERDYNGHWIRAEFQLRNEAALSFYIRAFERADIGKAYRGMLIDYLRFTTKPNNVNHTERLNTSPWWREFCSEAEKIPGFYVGGLEYNMQSLNDFITKQCGSSIKTLLTISEGQLEPLFSLVENTELNRKQQFLVNTKPLIDKMIKEYNKRANEQSRENEYLAIERNVIRY